MKSKICLLLLAFLCQISIIEAQEVDIQWGAEIEENKARPDFILGDYEGAIYAISAKNKKFFYQRYDNGRLSLELEKEIVMPKIKGSVVLIEKFMLVKDKVFVFYSDFDEKKRKLYLGVVNKDGNFTTDGKTIFEVQAESKEKITDFGFDVSLDQEYVAVSVLSLFEKGRDDKNIYFTKVFNTKLEVVNQYDLVLPVSKKKTLLNYINDFCTDNDGNIHILNSIVTIARNSTTPVNHYPGLQLFSNLQLTTHSRLEKKTYHEVIRVGAVDSETNFIQPIFTVDPQGDLLIAGLYTVKQGKMKAEGLEGIFFNKISGVNHKVEISKVTPLPIEARKIINPRYTPGKIEYVNLGMILDYIYFHENGEYTLLFEQSVANSYGTILVVTLDNSGNIKWTSGIHKVQMDLAGTLTMAYSRGIVQVFRDHFYSYLTGYNNGKIAIIYNDNPKNIETPAIQEKGLKILTEPKKGVPVMVFFDETGKPSNRIPVGSPDKQEVKIRPGVSYQVDEYTIIVYGTLGGKDKLGRITFTLD